jgi:predicted nucleotidyltransferase
MHSHMTPKQTALTDDIVVRLSAIPGIAAVVLGGSFARNRARPDSDIDIGIYYHEHDRFDVSAIRNLANEVNDFANPVVSGFGEWGRWVDGGAWLTVGEQRLDLLYRRVEMIEFTLSEAQAGRFEVDFAQQPPFGFFGPTVLGEVAIARPLHDPSGVISALKASVLPMPDKLREAIIQRCLWNVDFGLRAFLPKFVAEGDAYGATGCLTRFANELVLVMFALNRVYLVNDKTALAEIAEFPIGVSDFGSRISVILGAAGQDEAALARSMRLMMTFFEETVQLAGDLYQPAWDF